MLAALLLFRALTVPAESRNAALFSVLEGCRLLRMSFVLFNREFVAADRIYRIILTKRKHMYLAFSCDSVLYFRLT